MIKIFKNDKFKLNQKQIKAIELLINCEKKQKEIAVEIGVSEKTLYNWLRHNEEFRNAMEWYRREVYKDYAPEAVEILVDLMKNSPSDKVRLQAVKDLLDRAGDNAETKVDFQGDSDINVNISVVDRVNKK